MKHLLFIIAASSLLASCFSDPLARTWYIKPDSTGDAMTIQAGIDSSVAGDTVLVACGTYNDCTHLNPDGHLSCAIMKSGIVLRSETGMSECATIDAQNLGRVLYCESLDSTTHIVGITFGGGRLTSEQFLGDGGGVYCSNSNIKFDSCSFCGNGAYHGGGLYCTNSSPRLTGCSFSSNAAIGSGGGISGTGILAGCVFSGNTSLQLGGAIAGGGMVTDCIFSNNSTFDHGGAVSGGGTFINCEFSDNIADHPEGHGFGGAVSGSGTFIDCKFSDNGANLGGSIYSGSLELTNCAFSGSSSALGGGIYCTGIAQIFSCNFWGNFGEGGAIWAEGAALTVTNCTFYDNSGWDTGTLALVDISTATIENSIIAFSSSSKAVYCDINSSAELACCDIYGNSGGDWVGCIADQYGLNGNFSTDPLFCEPDSHDFHLAGLSDCLPENNWYSCGVLIGANDLGCDAPVGVYNDNIKNAQFNLMQNYPNPFNPITNIRFDLPEAAYVRLDIFAVTGALVKNLVSQRFPSGTQTIQWDGANSIGDPVASGIYFYRMTAGGKTLTKKMVLLK